ncbi:MAG: adenylate/guanylate cyclase domain-containing protein [Ardenticatenaceae bacterium]|nr:adenylate/guanylate cyclase domain-containing protein [Ardenticatenaceae bacterium]
MQSQYKPYDYLESFSRIDEILSANSASFEELNSIPSREKLTFTNGYYVMCSAVWVDIRDSSSLPDYHKRPTLAKLYRAYLSEVVAIINGNIDCAEINIIGDGVSAIFDTKYKADIESVFRVGYEIVSLNRVLNYKLRKRDIREIKIGVGMSYGRALMVKAGYKGSKINDVVWMGDVLNSAAKLSNFANKTFSDGPIMVSESIYMNLDEHSQSFLKYNYTRQCYHGNVIHTGMEEWYQANCID